MIAFTLFIQALEAKQLTADYLGTPGWDDNAATFEMIIVSNILHGEYQLANGYEHDKAKEIFKVDFLLVYGSLLNPY